MTMNLDILEIEHYFSNGLYAKRMVIDKGLTVGTHKHNFAHLSIVASGVVRVECDKSSRVYEAGECVVIAADVEHRIIALEDSIWFCLHATNETDSELIDETLIKA